MNKRARLTRRILREHRGEVAIHHELVAWGHNGTKVFGFWRCPRCYPYKLIPFGAPRDYR